MEIKKQIILLYGLTVILVFVLISIWEFQLEEPMARFFGIGSNDFETVEEHWEYIKTVTIFAAVSMTIPFSIAIRLEGERSRVQAEIEEKAVFYRTLIENSSDVTLTVRKSGEITYASPSVKKRFGYSPEELTGKSIEIYLHSLDAAEFMVRIDTAASPFDEAIALRGSRFVHNNGDMVFLEALFTEFPSHEEEASVVISCRDITERVMQERKVKFLAFHDQLTGLPNRSTFSDRLSMALEHSIRDDQPGAVLFLDIDDFKEVNDTLGHDAGDELLKKIAHRVKICLRKEDTVSRLGGDEFTCLLPRINGREDVEYVAHKILEEFNEPLMILGKKVPVGLSIGASLFPTHGRTAEELIKKADNAMYQVKNQGKHHFRIYS